MLALTIILILIFGLICVYASNDILNRTEATIPAWLCVLLVGGMCIFCTVLCYRASELNTLIRYSKGEIQLETQIHTDTTYNVQKLK